MFITIGRNWCVYRIDLTDVPEMCKKNASAAQAVGRKDLVQVS